MKTVPRTTPRPTRRIDRELHVQEAIRQYANVARHAFPQNNKRGGGRKSELFLWLDGQRISWVEASTQLGVSLTLIYKLQREGGDCKRSDSKRSRLLGRVRFEQQSEAA